MPIVPTFQGGVPQVRDYKHMLQLFNVIMTHAPSFDETGLVGFPFNAILDWSMATTGGWAGFIDKKGVKVKSIEKRTGRTGQRAGDGARFL